MRPRWNMSIYVPGFGQLFQCCRLQSLLSSTAGDCVHYIFLYLGDKLSKCCPVSDNRGYSIIPSMYKKVFPRNLRWGWDVSHPHAQELGWLCMTHVDEPNRTRDENTFSSLVSELKQGKSSSSHLTFKCWTLPQVMNNSIDFDVLVSYSLKAFKPGWTFVNNCIPHPLRPLKFIAWSQRWRSGSLVSRYVKMSSWPQQDHTRPADEVMRCCSMIVLWKILSDTSLPDLIRRIFHLHLRVCFWESQLVYQISVTNRDFSNMPNQPHYVSWVNQSDEVYRTSRGLTFASTSHGHQLYVPWPVALKGIKGFLLWRRSWWSLMINSDGGGPELKC